MQYNVFSTDGTGALIIFAQQMAQALLADADVLKCVYGTGALIIFAQQMAQALLADADVLKCVYT